MKWRKDRQCVNDECSKLRKQIAYHRATCFLVFDCLVDGMTKEQIAERVLYRLMKDEKAKAMQWNRTQVEAERRIRAEDCFD